MSLSLIISVIGAGVSVVGWIYTLGRSAERTRTQINGLGRRTKAVEETNAQLAGRVDEQRTAIETERTETLKRDAALGERIATVEATAKERAAGIRGA